MADFFQTGSFATLHRLGPPDVAELEAQLEDFAADFPIALVLPCHAQELETQALQHILQTLSQVRYVQEIVVGLDGATTSQWQKARKLFGTLPQKHVLLWNDGRRLKRLWNKLTAMDIATGPPGKGRNLWLCCGYVLASQQARMIAIHDCDIVTYDRELLARLCYPVAHPHLGFDFCKGYSARFTDRLNGRVMRLMVTPLVRSLQSILGENPFLKFLDTFRYPLAGEVSFALEVVRRGEMPSDWGVEVGMLAEVHRLLSPKSICQVEFSERYDHKHRELSSGDATRGLNKMAVDVAKCIFLTIAGHGIKLDRGIFDALLSTYLRKAQDTMRFYAADATINRLCYDRHEEELAVATFAHGIRLAAQAYLDNPLGYSMIPNWNRVESVWPNVFQEFLEAVRQDNGQ